MISFSESDLETFFLLMNTRLIKRGGSQYMASCPFPENHSSGKDKNPSFSIIYNGIISGWKCFGGCNDGGSLRSLAKKYNEEFGDSRPLEFIRSFDDHRSPGERAISRGSYKEEQAKKIARMYKKSPDFKKPITESDLKYLLQEYPLYAEERGMTKEQIFKWEIGYDPKENRMIIPVRDMHKKLLGVSGRALDPEKKPKYKHYTGLSKELVLYGERFINIRNPKCYIVEGFFDVFNLEKQGLENVFATMGTSLSEYQINKLLRFFKEIVFIPDGVDFETNAGLRFAEEYGQKLLIKISKTGIVGIAGIEKNPEYERREKPTKWESKDYKFKITSPLYGKDPSDLSKEDLQTVLNQTHYLSLVD